MSAWRVSVGFVTGEAQYVYVRRRSNGYVDVTAANDSDVSRAGNGIDNRAGFLVSVMRRSFPTTRSSLRTSQRLRAASQVDGDEPRGS